MDPTTLAILATVLAFVAGALLVIGFVPQEIDEDEIYGYRERKRERLIQESPIYQVALPLIKIFAHYLGKIPDRRFGPLKKLRARLRDRLPRSGYMGAFSVDEFLGMCCTVSLSMFVFSLLFTFWLTGTPRIPVAAIAAGAGMYLPFLSLNSAISQRLIEIDRRLPYTMDLLVLSMNAGLDFMTALDRVVEQGKKQNPDDPMVQELSVVLQELRVGTPRADALKNLCDRVNSEYLNSMVGAIIQSEKRGTPLATVLDVQISTIRKKRTQRIEKQASQAAVKILIPLMFIFGAVLVVVVGAMVLRVQS